MTFIKILFWLPSMLMQWAMLLFPFNPKTYHPSTETEREISQYMQNTIRLTNYKLRKLNG